MAATSEPTVDEQKQAPTVISFKVEDPEVAEYIRDIQRLMSFGSQRETTLFLIDLGIVALKMGSGTALVPADFARALWSVGRYGLHAGAQMLGDEDGSAISKRIGEYEQWVEEQRQAGVRERQRVTSYPRPGREPSP